jgi:serine phosphatase RsbU (regulator of sigma subunit)/ligand-binding sensor domain-containing protein
MLLPKINRYLLIPLLISITFSGLIAQQADIKFEHISLEQGLSQSIINTIMKDSKGFMWFGTQSGLNKYDGYEFVIYKNNPFDSTAISNNLIQSTFEDGEGFIWIGTGGGGLNKFNRETEGFTHYRHNPQNPKSISSDIVFFAFEDKSKNIWVFTGAGGVDLFNKSTREFEHFQHSPDDPVSLSHNNINWVYKDLSGEIWFGTPNGLNKFNREDKSFERLFYGQINDKKSGKTYISTIYESPKEPGVLWLTTGSIQQITGGKGLIRYDTKKNNYTFYKHNPSDPKSISSNVGNQIYESKSGVFWIATANGLNKFNLETGKFKTYLPNPSKKSERSNVILGFAEDMFGMILLITGDFDGGYLFNPQTESFSHYKYNPADPNSLSNNSITRIYGDTTGVFWIGTVTGGLNKIDYYAKKFNSYEYKPNDANSLKAQIVRGIHLDRFGEMWVGLAGGGLNRFDNSRKNVKHYTYDPNNPKSIADNNVWAVLEDKEGTLWIGTYGGGLDKFDRKSETFSHYRFDKDNSSSISNNFIRDIYEDSKGRLWVATDFGGLNLFDRETETFYRIQNDPDNPNSIPNNSLRAVAEDKFGNLWIGSFGGGLSKLVLNPADKKKERKEVFDTGGEIFTNYQHDPSDLNSLSDNSIQSIFIDDDGIIWIGTFGGGLNKFDPESETFTLFTDENSDLPNNVIYSVLGDEKGNIWMSSNRGITKYDPVKNIFTNYDMDDGLQSREFNGQAEFYSSAGEMFFGGINGLNSFYPDSLRNNPYPPRIAITDFELFNKSAPIGGDSPLKKHISETDEITLSHWQNDISFDFVALHYNKPEENKYAYMLENYDDNWINTENQRRATYTNLDPGEYVFKVIASNNDGVWNYEGESVKLIITQPWWQTGWSYAAYILFGIGFIYSLHKYQQAKVVKREQNKSQIREAELRAQTAEAQSRAIQAENERKTHELEEARKLQLSMLPKELPKVSSLDIAVHMQTATEVGGDYYDFYKDGNDSLTIVVGDATGHGLKAGTMVSVIKGLFISSAADTDTKTFFEKCTQTIKQLHLGNLYMALSFVKIENNELFASCAGMPPIYIYRNESKKVEPIVLKGMPLGAFDNFEYKDIKVKLNKGDSILLFSDGLAELFNDKKEMYDYERVKATFERVGHNNAQQIIDDLVDEVDEWRNGNSPNDDVTFVVLKMK